MPSAEERAALAKAQANPGLSIKEQLQEKARKAAEARRLQVERDRIAREERERKAIELERKNAENLATLQIRWKQVSERHPQR